MFAQNLGEYVRPHVNPKDLNSELYRDHRDQGAADLHEDAVRFIKKGKHREALECLYRCLDRGATAPNEKQGSQTRFLVYQYDPYYWMGVAHMELGNSSLAEKFFQKSLSFGVVKKWTREYNDLLGRLETLRLRRAVAQINQEEVNTK